MMDGLTWLSRGAFRSTLAPLPFLVLWEQEDSDALFLTLQPILLVTGVQFQIARWILFRLVNACHYYQDKARGSFQPVWSFFSRTAKQPEQQLHQKTTVYVYEVKMTQVQLFVRSNTTYLISNNCGLNNKLLWHSSLKLKQLPANSSSSGLNHSVLTGVDRNKEI